MTYDLVFVCYNGMNINILTDEEKEKVAVKVRLKLRFAREDGFTVNKIEKGRWEVYDDEAGMIGDDQGYLVIKRHRPAGRRRRVA